MVEDAGNKGVPDRWRAKLRSGLGAIVILSLAAATTVVVLYCRPERSSTSKGDVGVSMAMARPSRWALLMQEGRAALARNQAQDALRHFLAAAQRGFDAESRAEAYFYVGQANEALLRRDQTIQVYMKALDLAPNGGYVPRISFRLGELYTSVGLLPSTMKPEVAEAKMRSTMSDVKAIRHFERALTCGQAGDPWVVSSKMYLAGLYINHGRDVEGWHLLHEVASLDPESIESPGYLGRSVQDSMSQEDMEQELKATRTRIASSRQAARRYLLQWSMSPDILQRVINLRRLLGRCRGDPMEAKVRQALRAALTELSESARRASNLANEPKSSSEQ